MARVMIHCPETGEPVYSGMTFYWSAFETTRIGRNPKTGEEAPISAHRVVVSKPAQKLKQRVNHSEGPLTGRIE